MITVDGAIDDAVGPSLRVEYRQLGGAHLDIQSSRRVGALTCQCIPPLEFKSVNVVTVSLLDETEWMEKYNHIMYE